MPIAISYSVWMWRESRKLMKEVVDYREIEEKYGSPDESNVEGYFIDDEFVEEKEKSTGKERERQPDNERPRDYYDRDYTQEQERRDYQEYQDAKLDPLFSAGFGW